MTFHSFEFLVFFPVVTFLYFFLPQRLRWLWLLAASAVFYMAFIPAYILIILFTVTIDYFAALAMEKTSSAAARKAWLVLSLAGNLLILGFFKYYGFFNHNLLTLGRWTGLPLGLPVLGIVLPIGLSFHTFQAMAYAIEVFRGQQKAEHHYGTYALYVLFFPQLVAGPIERPGRMLPQFYERHSFDWERAKDGLKLMLWGYFKKLVIADRLALTVNHVYAEPSAHSGPVLILASVFFAYQIYCDFSAYSDIAIGAAQVLGFKLMDNFNRPYTAFSTGDFWRRWHISLSSWFRDYLYVPLGGNRCGRARRGFNVFVTFLASGLWHGANWTYVCWGALHGFYRLFSMATEDLRARLVRAAGLDRAPRLHNALKIAVTFSLVCFAWIFFRAETLPKALYIASHLFSRFGSDFTAEYLGMSDGQVRYSVCLIFLLEGVHYLQKHRGIRHMLRERPLVLRWSVYYSLIFLIILTGVFTHTPFIYFQF